MPVQTFRALGEANRLHIAETLRRGPRSVNELVDELSIRQPQVSKHLRVLAEAGLVTGERASRKRIYRLEPEPFDEVNEWIASFERTWDERMDSLGTYLGKLGHEGADR